MLGLRPLKPQAGLAVFRTLPTPFSNGVLAGGAQVLAGGAQASLLGLATPSVEVLERRIAAAQRRLSAAQRRPKRLANEHVQGKPSSELRGAQTRQSRAFLRETPTDTLPVGT